MVHLVRALRGWTAKALARGVIGVVLVMIAGLVPAAWPVPAVAAQSRGLPAVRVARPAVHLSPVKFRKVTITDQARRKFTATATRMPPASAGTADRKSVV